MIVVDLSDRGREVPILLNRNLLYTAVTRAAGVCVVVYQEAPLRWALHKRDAVRRYTKLAELVRGSR